MSEDSSRTNTPDPRPIGPPEWALWGILFALAYSQAPLFTSNQNQYFLKGLASAGVGQLSSDWLVGTLDPTPVFSALVWLTSSSFGPWIFYAEYAFLLAVYMFSLWTITRIVAFSLGWAFRPRLLLAGLTIVHSEALRYILGRIPGEHWQYLFEAGVAGQRLLGPVFQPSSFGVLLLLSLSLFLLKHPLAAVIAAALAASFHPTYLLAAACLTAGYMIALFLQTRRWQSAVSVAGVALLLVAPITLYTGQVFAPTGPDTWRLAAETLVEFRIPHHALPAQWFDLTVPIKATLLVLGLEVSRRSRRFGLFLPVMLLTVIGLALTVVQILSNSLWLAMLMPWRVSVVLVPIATTLLLSWGLHLLRRSPDGLPRLAQASAWLVALAGVVAFLILLNRQANDVEQPVFQEVVDQLTPGQIYLIPPKLQGFRLRTGAPAFVDFKSIPYKDREVLDWFERVRLAQFFYRDDPSSIDCGLLESIRTRETITHVILGAAQFGLDCPSLSVTYQDDNFALFEIGP